MKITIYELIGLIKDGKAPERIKYKNMILDYNDCSQDYCNFDTYYNLFAHLFDELPTKSFINDYVEIIEGKKKIEKMECSVESWFTPTQADIEIIKKVNELIDEINKLKEK